MEGTIEIGDGLCGQLQILDPDQLESQVIHPYVEGPGEQSQDDQDSSSQGPDRPFSADEPGYGNNGRPKKNISRHEATIGSDHQPPMVPEGLKLLGKEKMEHYPKQYGREKHKRRRDQTDAADPWAGEPKPGSALRYTSRPIRIHLFDLLVTHPVDLRMYGSCRDRTPHYPALPGACRTARFDHRSSRPASDNHARGCKENKKHQHISV